MSPVPVITRKSLYTGSAGRNLYAQPYADAGGNPSIGNPGEIDLRAELDELFFGYKSGIRHGYNVLIRRLRRDTQGKPLPCTCRHEITREPDPDCKFCLGEAYNWDEGWQWTYSMYAGTEGGLVNRLTYMPPGAVRVDFKVFFFRYDANISYGDKIVEVKLDEEGNLIVPYIRESIYQIQTINRYRADNSKSQYLGVYCREGDAVRLDAPQ